MYPDCLVEGGAALPPRYCQVISWPATYRNLAQAKFVRTNLEKQISPVLVSVGYLPGISNYLRQRIPQELQVIVPVLPSVPVRLLVQKDAREYRTIGHFKRYPWVIEAYAYLDNAQLWASLSKYVMEPAEKRMKESRQR